MIGGTGSGLVDEFELMICEMWVRGRGREAKGQVQFFCILGNGGVHFMYNVGHLENLHLHVTNIT